MIETNGTLCGRKSQRQFEVYFRFIEKMKCENQLKRLLCIPIRCAVHPVPACARR